MPNQTDPDARRHFIASLSGEYLRAGVAASGANAEALVDDEGRRRAFVRNCVAMAAEHFEALNRHCTAVNAPQH